MNVPTNITTGTIDIGGGVWLYFEESGRGEPILLVHGLWASSRFFRQQIADLGRDYRALAVDLRGHGRSSMTLSDQTVPTYARDLEAFMDRLGLEQVIAVGWSMGAFVWWDHFKQFGPARLRGLVVIDQPPTDMRKEDFPDGLISPDSLRDWYERVQTDQAAFMNEVLPMMFAKPPADADRAWMVAEMSRAPAVVAAAVLFDQSTRDYRETIRGYPVPTLVCSGALSHQPRAGSQMIVDSAKTARLKVFEGSGHSLFYEDSPAFNLAVRDFILTLPPR
jgi:pimeloyl-ACP methyl ester carboxylesterase